MARGDHIFVERLAYTHHGIDTGRGTVIHYTGVAGRKKKQNGAAVRETPIDAFGRREEIKVRLYDKCDSPDVILKRAESRLREARYSLVFNNCEHFATWCKTGVAESEQVADVLENAVDEIVEIRKDTIFELLESAVKAWRVARTAPWEPSA
jgi:hypothetical protein